MSNSEEVKQQSGVSGAMFLQEAAFLLQQLESNWLELELEMAPLYSMSRLLPGLSIADEQTKVAVSAITRSEAYTPNLAQDQPQNTTQNTTQNAA